MNDMDQHRNGYTGFDHKKILPITLNEYLKANGKALSDYEVVGIHFERTLATDSHVSATDDFARKIPQGTDVVVGYNATLCTASAGHEQRIHAILYGAALIPKSYKGKPDNTCMTVNLFPPVWEI